jgi:hypothetical protein
MEAFKIAFSILILVAMNVFFEKTSCFIVIDMIHDISLWFRFIYLELLWL